MDGLFFTPIVRIKSIVDVVLATIRLSTTARYPMLSYILIFASRAKQPYLLAHSRHEPGLRLSPFDVDP